MVIPHSHHSTKITNQSGFAIGPILFIIALLAVLAAAIAAGSGAFTGGTDTESARIKAATIIEYFNTLDTAIQKIENSGYRYDQISFELPPSELTSDGGNDYSSHSINPNCTTDQCKLFAPGGGGDFTDRFSPRLFYQCLYSRCL